MNEIVENIGKREVGFRAWSKKLNAMSNAFDLNGIADSYDMGYYVRGLWDYNIEKKENEKWGGENYCDINKCIVMQYTGLKDKNGEEIYEGDIVLQKYSDEKGDTDGYDEGEFVVEYNNEFAGFEPFCDYCTDRECFSFSKNCEVIGNVFENPELLEKILEENEKDN